MLRVTFEDVQAAAQRIAPYVHRTPVLTSRALNRLSGADLFFNWHYSIRRQCGSGSSSMEVRKGKEQ